MGHHPGTSEGHAKCKHVTWSTETDIRLHEVKCIEIIGIHSNIETDHKLMFLVIKLCTDGVLGDIAKICGNLIPKTHIIKKKSTKTHTKLINSKMHMKITK